MKTNVCLFCVAKVANMSLSGKDLKVCLVQICCGLETVEYRIESTEPVVNKDIFFQRIYNSAVRLWAGSS